MTNRYLISVAAAALIAGTGFANAQGAGGGNKEGAGSSVQHSAPATGGGAAQSAPQRGDAASEKAGASESKSMGSGKQAEDSMKGGQKPSQNKDMKAEGRDSKSGTVGQAPAEKGTQGGQDRMNAQPSQKGSTTDTKPDTKTDTNRAQQNQPATDTNRAQTSPQGGTQSTTGAVTSTRAGAPPPEKQTQIVSAIRQETSIKETTNVNFNISVGAVVPASVHFYPVPTRIIEIYPEWRGYQVILVKGRYIIVRPQTHEIVYIIEG